MKHHRKEIYHYKFQNDEAYSFFNVNLTHTIVKMQQCVFITHYKLMSHVTIF